MAGTEELPRRPDTNDANSGMRQADAPVGRLGIAVATGVPQEPAVKAGGRHLSNGPMLLKKSLSTADQNFSRPLMRFSYKNLMNLVS